MLTVLDEANAEDALALLLHEAGCPLDEGWEAVRVLTEPSTGDDKTEDAEACATRDGYAYLLGSQFGKKAGPLSARRSWIARIREDELVKNEQADAGDRAPALRSASRRQRRAQDDRPAAARPTRPRALHRGDDQGRREEALGGPRTARRSADQRGGDGVHAVGFPHPRAPLSGHGRRPPAARRDPAPRDAVRGPGRSPGGRPRVVARAHRQPRGARGLPRAGHPRRDRVRRGDRRPRRRQQVRHGARGPPRGRERRVRARALHAHAPAVAR